MDLVPEIDCKTNLLTIHNTNFHGHPSSRWHGFTDLNKKTQKSQPHSYSEMVGCELYITSSYIVVQVSGYI